MSANDDRPIVGARIAETGSQPQQAVTGDGGVFVLPGKPEWIVLLFPMEPWYLTRIRVSVSAEGYKPSEFWLTSMVGQITNHTPRGIPELIKLQPAEQ
jgi:hypothetical protein